MLEIYLLALLSQVSPDPHYVRVQVLPAGELFPTVSTRIAFAVHLTHVLTELRLLLEGNVLAHLACQLAFMGPLDMLPLLVTIWESLETSIALEVRALQLAP